MSGMSKAVKSIGHKKYVHTHTHTHTQKKKLPWQTDIVYLGNNDQVIKNMALVEKYKTIKFQTSKVVKHITSQKSTDTSSW